MSTRFQTIRPMVFELTFRSEEASRVAEAISAYTTMNVIQSAAASDVQAGGFGIVTARVHATSEAVAAQRLGWPLEEIGGWEDRSGGEYGQDAVLIFVPEAR